MTEHPDAVPRSEFIGLLLAGVALSGAIALTSPALRDPDSSLYAAMSSELATRTLGSWLQPVWPAGRVKTGPFLEHTAVSLWPGAALEKLGIPSGALVANALASLVLLVLVGALTASLANAPARVLALVAWGTSLAGVQYWLRANHEIWWACGVLLAALGVAWKRPALALGGISFSVAVKGVLGLDAVLLVAPLAWMLHGPRWTGWLLVGAATISATVMVGYETAHWLATGRPFFTEYLAIQLGYVNQIERASWFSKPLNLGAYLLKLVWFSLAGALAMFFALVRRRAFFGESRARPLLGLLFGMGLVVVSTSLMSRHAARYIFPCYPLLAVAGAVALQGSRLALWLHARVRWVLGSLVLIAFLRVALAQTVYREVNLLPGAPIDQR